MFSGKTLQQIPLTGVLLAGGKNSRMGGREKAFLPIDGSPLSEYEFSHIDNAMLSFHNVNTQNELNALSQRS